MESVGYTTDGKLSRSIIDLYSDSFVIDAERVLATVGAAVATGTP